METRKSSISPLRQRMIEDMRIRKFGEKTQYQYVRAVRQFAKYLGRSPETASVEELRNYQLHLVDQGKGQKDRYALLSPVLLERLRVWWRVARAQGKMLDGGWLFPG